MAFSCLGLRIYGLRLAIQGLGFRSSKESLNSLTSNMFAKLSVPQLTEGKKAGNNTDNNTTLMSDCKKSMDNS